MKRKRERYYESLGVVMLVARRGGWHAVDVQKSRKGRSWYVCLSDGEGHYMSVRISDHRRDDWKAKAGRRFSIPVELGEKSYQQGLVAIAQYLGISEIRVDSVAV